MKFEVGDKVQLIEDEDINPGLHKYFGIVFEVYKIQKLNNTILPADYILLLRGRDWNPEWYDYRLKKVSKIEQKISEKYNI